MESKVCSQCGIEKPATAEYFHRCYDGFHNQCKECKKAWQKANKERLKEYRNKYRVTNKESIANKMAEYYKNNKEHIDKTSSKYREVNKEQVAAKAKAYNKKNKIHISEKAKDYRNANKDHCYALTAEWVKANPDKHKVIVERRRAKSAELPSTLTFQQWENAKEHFGRKCCYCGQEKKLVQEHFVPVSGGGGYTPDNIVPACTSCNNSKGGKSFNEWYPKSKHYNKQREQAIINYLNHEHHGEQITFNMESASL